MISGGATLTGGVEKFMSQRSLRSIFAVIGLDTHMTLPKRPDSMMSHPRTRLVYSTNEGQENSFGDSDSGYISESKVL